MNMKRLILRFTPRFALKPLQTVWFQYKQSQFFRQGTKRIVVSGFELEIPRSHPLDTLLAAYPKRDQAVADIARVVGRKYPQQLMIDVGANVGDTIAKIASACQNPILGIEASDYYFEFLKKNTARMASHIELKQCFLSDGSTQQGTLHHWGGTAFLQPSQQNITSKRLADISSQPVCFIKSDTDGYDFPILTDSLDWLAIEKPVLFFENQIATPHHLDQANQFIQQLQHRNYTHFIIYDHIGIPMLRTRDVEAIQQLNGYLLNIQQTHHASISNYDIACFHESDRDLYDLLCSTPSAPQS